MRVVFDTNILIDYLLGVRAARNEIRRFARAGISIITWMEVLVGAADDEDASRIRGFLAAFDVHAVDALIAERAVTLRQAHRIPLPDAIIWATAQELGGLLVTRNTKDFPARDPTIRVPYRL